MRTLKPREIELKGQEIQRSVRQRLESFNPSCHKAIVDQAIMELVLLSKEIEDIFPEQPFEEPADAQAKLARTDEGTASESLAMQQPYLKPVHAKKKRPRLQGVS